MPRKDIYKDAVPFKRQGDLPGEVPLAKTTFGVRLPEDIDKVIRSLPEPTAWARQVLINAVERELLGQAQGTGKGNMEPSPPPASPPLDADTLVQVLTEVLAVPRLPAAAKKKLESLLEKMRERLTK